MTTIWELDFYSRPILDDNQKKVWEMLVCESPKNLRDSTDALFRYSQFCPSTQVNSIWLRQALEQAIAQAPEPPNRIRFFRRQMTNMITRACEELDLNPQPSRRTVALCQWLRQREREIYPQQAGYQPIIGPSVQYSDVTPLPLPDALRPDQWAVVSLTVEDFAHMSEWDIKFQDGFPLEPLNLDPRIPIPGIIFYSTRATPLAAWMSGIEPAFLGLEPSAPPQLVLETGATDRWIVANLTTELLQTQLQNFEQAKERANRVHFLAIQTDSHAEDFAGFWLLQELDLG